MKEVTVELEIFDEQIKKYDKGEYDEGLFNLLCTIYEELSEDGEVTIVEHGKTR